MSEFLEVRQASKSFPYGTGSIHVLQGISLDLRAGVLATITGDSGSGKSTLLHVIGGMERPDEGEVRIKGTSFYQLDGDGQARFRNREIGFVFQFHHLLPEFDALENAMMPLLIRGETPRQAAPRTRRLLEEIGLGHRLLNRPGELSGGEQQRLAIARALVSEPSLILMDEPTGNLDHRTGEQIVTLVERIVAERGVSVILVTHNPDIAARGSRVFRMTDGRLEVLDPFVRGHETPPNGPAPDTGAP
jgi:lipoprotein-releasing system ATP-binding protein